MLSLASNSVKGRDVIAGIVTRIKQVYTTGQVRVVVAPNPDGPDYVAQEGVTIRVPSAEPFDRSGAGRAGLVTHRRIQVTIATSNMIDEAGSDLNAAYAHLDLEEQIIDAVLDLPMTKDELIPPLNSNQQIKLGIKVRWVPGGSEIARRMKQDPSYMMSVLLFDIEYPASVRVTRT